MTQTWIQEETFVCQQYLLTTTERQYNLLEAGLQTYVIILDFAKAFDKVSHEHRVL